MSITISKAAAGYILQFLENERRRGVKKDQPLRLALKRGGGCGSFTPELIPNAGPNPDEDEMIEESGLTIVCNLAMIPELDGTTIDLESTALGDRIVYRNENLDACGCGKAYTPKGK